MAKGKLPAGAGTGSVMSMMRNDQRGRDQPSANRVYRGGSWNANARNVRAAYRNGNEPGIEGNNLGFRLASAQGVGESVLDPISFRLAPLGRRKHSGAGVSVGRSRGSEGSPAFPFSFEPPKDS